MEKAPIFEKRGPFGTALLNGHLIAVEGPN